MCCLKLLEHLYYCAEISLSAAIVLDNLILFINYIEICSFITIQFNNLAKNNLITKTYLYCYCRVHTQHALYNNHNFSYNLQLHLQRKEARDRGRSSRGDQLGRESGMLYHSHPLGLDCLQSEQCN